MTVSLYTFADLYSRVLMTLDGVLTKGADHAAGLGITESEMLGWRLIGDMHPLSFQAMTVINLTTQWPARVLGLPEPESIGPEPSLAGIRTEIARAKAWLGALTPEQFTGRDDLALTYQLREGFEPTLPGGQWLTVFATTNIYFHLSTAYGILRANGVPLGKPDMFGGGL